MMNYFNKLISKINSSSNSEKAKEIKKKLFVIGVIGTVIGALCVIGGFITFGLFGMDFDMAGTMISMAVFALGGFILSMSIPAVKAALAIVITQQGSKFVDLNSYCPKCGDIIEKGEKYCNKCGNPLLVKKVCPKCSSENSMDDVFCKQCGSKLED